MAYREMFSAAEWQTLQFAPLWVFCAVAQVDGLEQEEFQALTGELNDAAQFKNVLAREVISTICSDARAILLAYKNDSRRIDAGLKEVSQLLQIHESPAIARDFKRTLINIGHRIADAAGQQGQSRSSQQEQKVIAAVCLMLDLSIVDLQAPWGV